MFTITAMAKLRNPATLWNALVAIIYVTLVDWRVTEWRLYFQASRHSYRNVRRRVGTTYRGGHAGAQRVIGLLTVRDIQQMAGIDRLGRTIDQMWTADSALRRA